MNTDERCSWFVREGLYQNGDIAAVQVRDVCVREFNRGVGVIHPANCVGCEWRKKHQRIGAQVKPKENNHVIEE